MDVLAAVDALDDLVDRAPGIPLTDGARVRPEEFEAAVERIRSATRTELGLLPGPELARALEDLPAASRPIPLTSTLAISRTRMQDALDRVRIAVAASRGGATPEPPPRTPLMAAIDAVEEQLSQARIVPLTPTVRVEKPELQEALSRLRALAVDVPGAKTRVDELEWLAQAAVPVPLTSQIRLDPRPFRRVLERLRALAAAVGSSP
jgi:hypothetical protein